MDADNHAQSILSFVRYSKNKAQALLFVCNFTPMVYYDFHLGVPKPGKYQEIFNSDSLEFGGSGEIIANDVFSIPEGMHNFSDKIIIKIPPMATVVFKITD